MISYARHILVLKDGEGYNPYRDENGRFASGDGAGGGKPSARSSKDTPTKPRLSATAASKLRSSLEAGGSTRKADRSDVLDAYHSENAQIDKFFLRDGVDKGGVHSLKWDKSEKPPKDYPKDWPKAPRVPKIKQGDYDPKSTYTPPMKIEDINKLHTMGESGRYAARVLLNDLYAHGRARQGTAVDSAVMYSREKPMMEFMAKNGLSSMNWEWHHMIPAARGGSNQVRNVVLFNGGEHTLAHQLEAAIVQEKIGGGKIKAGNMGTHSSIELATAIRAQNNITKQLGSAAGYLRNAKYGGKEGAAKKPPMSAKDLKALEAKWNKSHKNYIDIAIKAGVWPKGSALRYNKVGVDYGKDAQEKIRKYLLKNPIKPFQYKD